MDAENHSTIMAGIIASQKNLTAGSGLWKGNDSEDAFLLFSIIYRALFNEDIFSSTNSSKATKKEIIIDGANKEFNLSNVNKIVKMITEEALKRIVKLDYFKSIVKIVFEEKYPDINHLQLDLEAIINIILQNFKSVGDARKLGSEGGEEKATDEDKDLIEYESNLKDLHENLVGMKKEIKALETQMSELPEKVIRNLAKKKKTGGNKATKGSNLSVKNLTEAKLKMQEEKKGSDESTQKNSPVTKSSGENSSNTKNGNGSNKLSKDSSMSVSNSNGNGSYDSNERCELEEFDKEDMALGPKIGRGLKETHQEKSKLPKKATDILQAWFLKNINHPYPNNETKEMLQKATSINIKQIQNWFTNSRKRWLEPIKRKIGREYRGKKSVGAVSQPLNQENEAAILPEPLSQATVVQKPNNPKPLGEPAIQKTQPNSQPLPQLNAVSQPMIVQNPGEPIPQNGFYYTNGAQPFAIQQQGGQSYPMNYMRPPSGQIFMPAGYLPQPQVGPVFFNSPPQGAYILVNNPVQNFLPVGMVPINGSYLAPVQPYPIIDQNGFSNNQGMMDMRGVYTHNLSTNFNTIHNNVFNNINHTNGFHPQGVGYTQPVYVAATPRPNGIFIEENNSSQLPRNDASLIRIEANNKSDTFSNSKKLIPENSNRVTEQNQPNFSQNPMTSKSYLEFGESNFYEDEIGQRQRSRENAGNSSDLMKSQPEKRVHKDDGTPTNAFNKPQ